MRNKIHLRGLISITILPGHCLTLFPWSNPMAENHSQTHRIRWTIPLNNKIKMYFKKHCHRLWVVVVVETGKGDQTGNLRAMIRSPFDDLLIAAAVLHAKLPWTTRRLNCGHARRRYKTRDIKRDTDDRPDRQRTSSFSEKLDTKHGK